MSSKFLWSSSRVLLANTRSRGGGGGPGGPHHFHRHAPRRGGRSFSEEGMQRAPIVDSQAVYAALRSGLPPQQQQPLAGSGTLGGSGHSHRRVQDHHASVKSGTASGKAVPTGGDFGHYMSFEGRGRTAVVDTTDDNDLLVLKSDQGRREGRPPRPPRPTREERAAERAKAVAPITRAWHDYVARRKHAVVVHIDDPPLVNDAIVASGADTHSSSVSGVESSTRLLQPRDLWSCATWLQKSDAARTQLKTVVTGSRAAIDRIWAEYGIAPNVIFAPDDPDADADVARWTQRGPVVILRAPGADINRKLLSAEMNDGYAAEFSIPDHPLFTLSQPLGQAGDTNYHADGETEDEDDEQRRRARGVPSSVAGAMLTGATKDTGLALGSVVVLVDGRIPSNVGLLVQAAVEQRYDAIVLIGCADVFSEKVIRASGGAVLSPKARLFVLPSGNVEATVETLQQTCVRHNLAPMVTVPDQDAMPLFQAAQELFYFSPTRQTATNEADKITPSDNNKKADDVETPQRPPDAPSGALVMLGSESQGLESLMHAWEGTALGASGQLPYRPVAIPMANCLVESINVAVAGTIAMHAFRPAARAEQDRLFAKGVVPDAAAQLGPSTMLESSSTPGA